MSSTKSAATDGVFGDGVGYLCVPEQLREAFAEQWERIVIQRGPIPAGSTIVHQKQPFGSLYGVRSGWLKEVRHQRDRRDHIVAFECQGDMIGLSAVAGGAYCASVVTLDTVSLCEIPFDRLLRAAADRPELRKRLYALIAEHLVAQQRLMRLMKSTSAESRVAAFLSDLSSRLSQRGFSGTNIHLPMPRGDIANYLGLTVETVSRVFSRFAADGILSVNNRDIEIARPQALTDR